MISFGFSGSTFKVAPNLVLAGTSKKTDIVHYFVINLFHSQNQMYKV